MSILDTKEWFLIADEDYEMALILNNAEHRIFKGITYHCAQAAEKYLKGFLAYNNIIPEKTHDLLKLLNKCISIDTVFMEVMTECDKINEFNNEVRYPFGPIADEKAVNYCLSSIEKIRKLEIFLKIRAKINDD